MAPRIDSIQPWKQPISSQEYSANCQSRTRNYRRMCQSHTTVWVYKKSGEMRPRHQTFDFFKENHQEGESCICSAISDWIHHSNMRKIPPKDIQHPPETRPLPGYTILARSISIGIKFRKRYRNFKALKTIDTNRRIKFIAYTNHVRLGDVDIESISRICGTPQNIKNVQIRKQIADQIRTRIRPSGITLKLARVEAIRYFNFRLLTYGIKLRNVSMRIQSRLRTALQMQQKYSNHRRLKAEIQNRIGRDYDMAELATVEARREHIYKELVRRVKVHLPTPPPSVRMKRIMPFRACKKFINYRI